MKRISLILLASALVAGSAQATPLPAPYTLVAGWDHSQYLAVGAQTIDGATLATALPANYSDFDPTFGAGADANDYGTLYLAGNGASANASTDLFPATQSDITLGKDLPDNEVPVGDVQFDADTVLDAEGQAFTSLTSIQANSPLSIVYSADVGGLLGNGWRLDLVGLAVSASTVTVDISTDGASYTDDVASFMLGTSEAERTVDFGTALDGASEVFVRLNFDANTPRIDNVGLSAAEVVPEPGTLLLVGAGLIGLAHGARRRAC